MRKIYLLILIVLTLFLFSCAGKGVRNNDLISLNANRIIKKGSATSGKEKLNVLDTPDSLKNKEPGSPRVELIKVPSPFEKEEVSISSLMHEPERAEKIKLPEDEIQISIEDMPVYDFINLVFGKILNLNYVVAPDVQKMSKKITLNMTSSMKPRKFFGFISDLLKDYGIAIKYEAEMFKIEKLKNRSAVPRFSPKIFIGRSLPLNISEDEKITLISPTYYINNNHFLYIVNQFIKGGEFTIKGYPYNAKMLLISGRVNLLREVLRLLKTFDRPYFINKQFYLLVLDYLSVDEFYTEIQKILKAMAIPLSSKPVEHSLSLIPLKRKNALFIISPQKSWVDTVVYWKNQLDTIDALGDEPQLFVYRPQNRSADELLNVLKTIMTTDTVTVKSGSKKKTATIKTKSIQQGFKATVDKERNTLIIMAYPSDYKKIRRILEKLDTQPKQVLIEVTIAEVTLTDQLQFGFEWYLKHAASEYIGEVQTLGGLGIGGAGFNFSLIATSQKFNFLLNAFAKKNLINIVSTPHIVVLDGKDATINVGTEVPVVSSETTATDITTGTGSPSILRNVQYRRTGVNLRVKPIVTSNDMLAIDVSQELSEAQANNVSNIDSPIILNRSINTSLVLKSGETVLLGGLISENISKTRSKIPLLGDIPIIGHLFSVDSKGKNKTELIVLITPLIIQEADQLKEITEILSEGFQKNGVRIKKDFK